MEAANFWRNCMVELVTRHRSCNLLSQSRFTDNHTIETSTSHWVTQWSLRLFSLDDRREDSWRIRGAKRMRDLWGTKKILLSLNIIIWRNLRPFIVDNSLQFFTDRILVWGIALDGWDHYFWFRYSWILTFLFMASISELLAHRHSQELFSACHLVSSRLAL